MRAIPRADVRGRVEASEFAVLWIVSRVLSERAKNQKPARHHFPNINFNSLTFLTKLCDRDLEIPDGLHERSLLWLAVFLELVILAAGADNRVAISRSQSTSVHSSTMIRNLQFAAALG